MERLGFGGMGIVYLCEHQVMRHKVAIKVLPTSKNDNPAALGRFYREARAAAALDHPNIVRAHDVDHEGNIHYLVLDYVDGASLHQIVTRSGPLAPARATHYIGQAALGLEHARQAGLVHRDIKPANILVDRAGTARILDLGLARFYDDETDPLTLKYDENNVLGTSDYVSPEQALNSHDVDTRTDIYSLGCTFYFVLTGRPPFPDGKAGQKLIWHQTREPQAIRSLQPGVPEELAAVVARMMAKHPDNRYQTPGEVAVALEAWLREPAPVPTEEELPRLCAAASRNATQPDINLGSISPGSAFKSPIPALRPTPMPVLDSSSRNAGGLQRPPRPRPVSAAELATPNVLASSQGVDTDKPSASERPRRPGAPPRPQGQVHTAMVEQPQAPIQRPLQQRATSPAPEPSLIGLAIRLVLLLILGILATAGARHVASRVPRPGWMAASFPDASQTK